MFGFGPWSLMFGQFWSILVGFGPFGWILNHFSIFLLFLVNFWPIFGLFLGHLSYSPFFAYFWSTFGPFWYFFFILVHFWSILVHFITNTHKHRGG